MEFIDIISAAMAIAEELSTRTGFKKLVDNWQDWKSQHGWPMFVFTDIGKGNINENTAKAVDLSPLDYNPDFKKALKNLESILQDMKIGVSRFSGSWNVLLPIIYFIYYTISSI